METASCCMEHRYGTRVKLNLRVQLQTPAQDLHHARILDASISGVLIETRIPLPLLSAVALRPLLAEEDAPWLEACVVRTDGGRAGLEWLEPEMDAVRALLFMQDTIPQCITHLREGEVRARARSGPAAPRRSTRANDARHGGSALPRSPAE